MVESLVTGANRGIGLELVKQLKAMQHRVTAVCRKSSAQLDSLGVNVVSGVDVSSPDAAAQLARAGDAPLDWLVANAGILQPDSLAHLDFEAAQRQFEVNALGALRTVLGLLPRLRSGSKVALITSRMGSIADNTSGNFYGYRMSKAALNAAGMSLARDLKPRGIAVAIVHPGYVKTDMTAMAGGTEPAAAAAQLIARIQGCKLENSGTFWHANGDVLPW